jgi:hypothetical protein
MGDIVKEPELIPRQQELLSALFAIAKIGRDVCLLFLASV